MVKKGPLYLYRVISPFLHLPQNPKRCAVVQIASAMLSDSLGFVCVVFKMKHCCVLVGAGV